MSLDGPLRSTAGSEGTPVFSYFNGRQTVFDYVDAHRQKTTKQKLLEKRHKKNPELLSGLIPVLKKDPLFKTSKRHRQDRKNFTSRRKPPGIIFKKGRFHVPGMGFC